MVPAVWSGPVQHHIGCLQVHVHHTGGTNGQQATPHVMQHLDKEGQGARHAHLHHIQPQHNTAQHITPQTHAHWTVTPHTQGSGRAGIQRHTKGHGARRQGGQGGQGGGALRTPQCTAAPCRLHIHACRTGLVGQQASTACTPQHSTTHTHSRTLNIVRASARLMLCMAMR